MLRDYLGKKCLKPDFLHIGEGELCLGEGVCLSEGRLRLGEGVRQGKGGLRLGKLPRCVLFHRRESKKFCCKLLGDFCGSVVAGFVARFLEVSMGSKNGLRAV